MATEPKTRNPEVLKDALAQIIVRLQKEADDRVTQRKQIENRWISDIRLYHGEYDQKVLEELKAANKSTLFVNQTRTKTDACEARLSDMLFPTDDRNWSIDPTPVPQLTEEAEAHIAQGKSLVHQANAALENGDPNHQSLSQQAQGEMDAGHRLRAEMEEAKKRAKAMQDEIDDQLRECAYNLEARDALHQACVIGSCVIKGPVAANDQAVRTWEKGEDNVFKLVYNEDPRPALQFVDAWSVFPESDALTPAESESWFERHLMTKRQLRKLARQPGFDADAIRRLLKFDPDKTLPTYLNELRGISGGTQPDSEGRYQVWEYRGPLTAEDMQTLCECLDKDFMAEKEEIDPLMEIQVVLWFCQDEILKFGIHHLDSEESIYSVYNLARDESSVWGFGVPYLMRASQSALNGAWRMVMDNGGLSSGPQIEIDENVVEPVDGVWSIVARKIWRRKSTASPGKPGIITYDIPSHIGELLAVIDKAKDFIDDETAISEIAQGEQGAHITPTANGMAMLMNAVNVIFRRMVKNWDDDVTTPAMRRMYDWNMQFSDKEYIKGDYQVDARGTSVLLVREIQSQNLMALLQFTGHPVLGMLLKAAALMRKTVQSMMIPADEVIFSDDQIKANAEKMQENQGGAEDPEAAKAGASLQLEQFKHQAKMEELKFSRETELIKYAATMNFDLDKLKATLADKAADRASKERMFAGEVGVKQQMGQGI